MSGANPAARSGGRTRSRAGKNSTPPASSKIALTPWLTPALYAAARPAHRTVARRYRRWHNAHRVPWEERADERVSGLFRPGRRAERRRAEDPGEYAEGHLRRVGEARRKCP